ncbi:Na+/H+ antiporter [Kurthia massiliensis]|uniref:Na+/H+ antiporter n=1 Tax=Kurthia massiliensis TaxID=1033739 RepID=UPI000287DF76|nr:Na+/H+ antiporter [Kurthia massiliensis]
MDLIIIVLLLILSLLLSNIIGHYLPFIPMALVQIGFGILIAVLFPTFNIHLESEWFLLLFVAPLLYNDGRNFPREDLWNMRGSILSNAIVLVIITTLAGGWFIHWLIPSIPYAASFALAAILSPTDPVAVNGIAKRVQIPERILSVVRGESLINDASGLVAFKFAVAAAVSGYFSLQSAVLTFAYTFVVGAVLGLVLSVILTQIRFWLRHSGIRDSVFHTLFQLVTPFVIYLVAEDIFHASGVIAVVIGGIAHALMNEKTETILAEEQLLTENSWSISLFVLNGLVFLLLGLNIPDSMKNSISDRHSNSWILAFDAIIIAFVILGIRFVWSHFFNSLQYKLKNNDTKPTIKMSLISSLVGVRGAVTMAGILSLPYVINDGDAFPERTTIIFLASAAILVTLLLATIFLPILTDKDEGVVLADGQYSFNRAKMQVLLKSLQSLQSTINDENRRITYELIDDLQQMFRQLQLEANAEQSQKQKQELAKIRERAIQVERKYVTQLYKTHQLDEDMYTALTKTIEERLTRQETNMFMSLWTMTRQVFRMWLLTRRGKNNDKTQFYSYIRMRQDVRRQTFLEALQFLRAERDEAPKHKKPLYVIVIYEYEKAYEKLRKVTTVDSAREEEIREELHIQVMETQRSEIHRMYEEGLISREQEKDLRRFVNYIESVSLYEYVD